MKILEKIISKDSVLRSSQNTRSYIMKQTDPRAAANAIIKELGVDKTIPSLYDARITAMNMVGDYVKLGSEFDHNQSFEHGVKRAEAMRNQYPFFAKEEDEMDAASNVVKPEKPLKAPKVVNAKDDGDKKRAILKSGKERGSMREVARKIYLENKDAPNKVVVQLIAEALNIPKMNAYTHVYLVKQELKKKASA